MMIPKFKPVRNKKYKKWIKEQPCCNCGAPADDQHHLIGIAQGTTGTTACDLLSMPLCRGCHTMLHNTPALWGNQWKWIAETLQKAIRQGVIKTLPDLAVDENLF